MALVLFACSQPEKKKIDLTQSNDHLAIAGIKGITGQLGEGCKFEVVDFGMAIIGNNGRRSEEWLLETCKGPIIFWVEHYPLSTFPERSSEYEVTGKFGAPAEPDE